ncbi:MAG: glycoside hydrolase family 88 protein [Bryobacteraceae bacterium]|jgi:rhamnogalacturonyl hydrolase YesR
MNRRSFLYGSAVLAAARPSAAAAADVPLAEKVAQAALAMQRHSWEQGILAQAFLDMGDRERVILMAKGAIVEKDANGRLAAIGGGATDPAMGGAAYWRAAELTGDPGMRQAAQGLLDFVLKKAPRATDGTCYHVFNAPEMWSDSFYTTPPFLAATGHYDDALRQIEGLRRRLWSPESKLLSHIWDDGRREFRDKAFWGVGNGWAAAGITRVIAALPVARRQDQERLAAFLRELLDACLAHQRADGLFPNVLDQPESFVETNLAQILAFTIYTGVPGGWLPASYVPAADRMRAAARTKVDQHGFVQGVCGAPSFDHAGVAAEGQAFFLMMEAASARERRAN